MVYLFFSSSVHTVNTMIQICQCVTSYVEFVFPLSSELRFFFLAFDMSEWDGIRGELQDFNYGKRNVGFRVIQARVDGIRMNGKWDQIQGVFRNLA